MAWRRYSVTPLRPEPGIQVPTEPGDPLRATLRGQIHINVKQSMTVSELRLVRQTVDSDWVIAEDPEPVRTWLGEPSPDETPKHGVALSFWLAMEVILILFLSASWRKRRASAPVYDSTLVTRIASGRMSAALEQAARIARSPGPLRPASATLSACDSSPAPAAEPGCSPEVGHSKRW